MLSSKRRRPQCCLRMSYLTVYSTSHIAAPTAFHYDRESPHDDQLQQHWPPSYPGNTIPTNVRFGHFLPRGFPRFEHHPTDSSWRSGQLCSLDVPFWVAWLLQPLYLQVEGLFGRFLQSVVLLQPTHALPNNSQHPPCTCRARTKRITWFWSGSPLEALTAPLGPLLFESRSKMAGRIL